MVLKLCTVVPRPKFDIFTRAFRLNHHFWPLGLIDIRQVDLEFDLDLVAVDVALQERVVVAGALSLHDLVVVLQPKDDAILVILLLTGAVSSTLEVQAGRPLELLGCDEVQGKDDLHDVDRVRRDKAILSGALLVDTHLAVCVLHVEAVVLSLQVPVFDDLVISCLHVFQLELVALHLVSVASGGREHELR